MVFEALLCVWFLSVSGLSAQSSYSQYFGNDDLPAPYSAPPAQAMPYVPNTRTSIMSPRGPTAVDSENSEDYGGSAPMSPLSNLGALSVLAGRMGGGGDPHLDFCRKCPNCVSCTGMRINPQVKADSIFLAAFSGPRKHSANLQDLANYALQEHMRKFGLSPLTISVADCKVRSSAYRGFVKLCECSGMRSPEFQLEVNNLGKLFQFYRKHLATVCDNSVCEITGFLPKGAISYSFASARREFEIPFPDRLPVKIQLDWSVKDQQNVMQYSIKRRHVLEMIRKASTVTKRIPNSEFVHRVMANVVEKKFDTCYKYREVRDMSDIGRSTFRDSGLSESGFRDSSMGDSAFRDAGFRDAGMSGDPFGDRMRDDDFGRDRGPSGGDYGMMSRDRPDKRPQGPIYTEL